MERLAMRDGTDTPAVVVDREQVSRVAALLKARQLGQTGTPVAWDNPKFWNVNAGRAARCQFLTVGNAINFRFWKLTGGQVVPSAGAIGGVDYRGSMYMWRRLRVAVSCGDFKLDADFLSNLTTEQFRNAFAADDGSAPLEPGMADRVRNLKDLGDRLGRCWAGEFVHLVDATRGSLRSFAQLSAEFRAFDDPVEKLTMVNAIMLTGSGLVTFDERPLPGIDYHLVKQALRQGLVVPSAALEAKLTHGDLLDREESMVLRRATRDALVEVGDRSEIATDVIDNVYWENRRVCRDPVPACVDPNGEECPFELACAQRTTVGMPLELTRYY